MKILIIGGGDNGGASWWLSDAINKYTPHEARSVRRKQSYINYPFDVIDPNKRELSQLVQWADVIHARDSIPAFVNATKKGKVVTFTGRGYRKRVNEIVPTARTQGWLVTVSTPNLQLFYPSDPPLWLPNPREEMVANGKHSKFTLCHAPTYRHRKGTDTIIQAVDGLAELDLIENVSYIECLKRKARCHGLIDQFRFGYGNNAIEAWALGMPVISGAYKEYDQHIKSVCGSLPYIHVDERVDKVQAAIKRLARPKVQRHWADRGREHFYRFHHAPAVAKRVIKLYKMALG